MRFTRVAILVVVVALSTGVAVHILGSKRVAMDVARSVELNVKNLPYAFKNRDQLAGTSIWLVGRIFTDGGGNHWIVDSIGDEPYRTYALQLSAWPFRSDPPIGTWSTPVQIFGRFEKGAPDSKFDFIIGPSKIMIPEGLSRPGEPLAPWNEDTEQAVTPNGSLPPFPNSKSPVLSSED